MTTRRSFLLGFGAALAAPAIVRADSLMKIVVPARRIIPVVAPNLTALESVRALMLAGAREYINAQIEDALIFGRAFRETDPTSPIGVRHIPAKLVLKLEHST